MKIALLGYTGDRGNWGCQSTSRKLLRFLRHVFAHRSPEVATVAIPRAHPIDRLHAAAHGDRVERILREPAPDRRDLRFLESLALERHGRLAAHVRDADLVVFQAEGSLGPSPLLRNAQLLLLPVVAKSLWGKPVLTMNQTWHASGEADGSLLADIFRRFDLNAVRESLSLAFARRIGLPDTLLCPDLALAVDEPRAEGGVIRLAPGYFCVTGSASLGHYDLAGFAAALREVARVTRLRPVLIHSRRRDGTPVARILPDAESLGPDRLPTYQDMAEVVKGAAFTLGGRYHTAIAGLVHGVPAMVLPGNNPKGEGLARMVPAGARFFLPAEVDRMAECARGLLEEGDGLRRRVSGEVAGLQEMQRRFGLLLRARFAPDGPGEAPPPMADFTPASEPYAVDQTASRLYAATNGAEAGTGRIRARISLACRRLSPGFTRSIGRTFTDLP